ncbi:MAG: FHA domain-containing protein [Planctomycetes bacterium]|nr:FHA domain-containing protein [Planctomycetota bacterium]
MATRRNTLVNQPALIPIAGGHDRKPRVLDRDVTTIGRARGSDLCMEANEISVVHCIIFRTPEGYRIRDCNSRSGTRVNGESVRQALLHDADVVNVGPFSFEFHVPAALFPKEEARPDPVLVDHWKESRRRLAQLALKLRRRLQSTEAVSPRQQEWAQKAHLLKEKIRCYDQRLGELEAAEEELTQERQQLAIEGEKQRQRVQEIEQRLSVRLNEAEEEIRERWRVFQQRCQAEEARMASQLATRALAAADEADSQAALPRQEARDQAQHLREREEQLKRQYEHLQREQQEFSTMRQQWATDQARTSANLDEQQAAIAQQKAELLRLMAELKKMQENLRKHAKPDVQALHDAIEQLEAENAELREHLHAAATPQADDETQRQIEDLRTEVNLLREDLDAKEEALLTLQNGTAPSDAPLRSENDLLKKLLEEKNRLVEQLTAQTKGVPKSENDLERYETELNEFRRQLEGDRAKLNRELEMLRERNKEMDETIRDMEMEMSKERAELARERMRLDRVREEVKSDSERLQREQSVRDSLAPVQKLRDELAQKHPSAKAEKPLNDRLKGIRNQLSDTPTAGS